MLLFSVLSISSCSFDHDDMRIISKIDGNYYLAEHPGYSNDGNMIVYTKDKEMFQVLSPNCSAVYKGSGIVFFIKRVDSNNVEYYRLKTKDSLGNGQANSPVVIDKVDFFKNIGNLVEISSKK